MRAMPLQATQLFCVIELSAYGARQFLIQTFKLGRGSTQQTTQRQQASYLTQVRRTYLGYLWILHLEHQRLAIQRYGPMYLPQGRGRKRLLFNVAEKLTQVRPINVSQMRLQMRIGQRRDPVLQPRQGLGYRQWQYALPLRSHLTQLQDRPLHISQHLCKQVTDRLPIH